MGNAMEAAWLAASVIAIGWIGCSSSDGAPTTGGGSGQAAANTGSGTGFDASASGSTSGGSTGGAGSAGGSSGTASTSGTSSGASGGSVAGSSTGISGHDADGAITSDIDSAGGGDTSTTSGYRDGATSDSQGTNADAAEVDRVDSATGIDDAATADTGAAVDSAATTDSAITPVCTSMMNWTSGNTVTMRPGESCLSCHTAFTIAGTVYPTAHEPDDCDGSRSTGNLTVVITDANGAMTSIPVNGVGNFFSTAVVAEPFQAKVVDSSSGLERDMPVSQTVGDCNSCHTVLGANSAPGRIMAP